MLHPSLRGTFCKKSYLQSLKYKLGQRREDSIIGNISGSGLNMHITIMALTDHFQSTLVLLVKKKLSTLPEHMSSPRFLVGFTAYSSGTHEFTLVFSRVRVLPEHMISPRFLVGFTAYSSGTHEFTLVVSRVHVLPEHMSSPWLLVRFMFLKSVVFCVVFSRSLFFCLFSFGHYIVCPSNYVF